MPRFATKEELIPVAQKYCEIKGHKFMFVSDDTSTFGYETKDGLLVHRSFEDLADEIREKGI